MIVGIFTNSLYWGGLEVHTIALTHALRDAGHQVFIVCFGTGAYDLYKPRLPHDVTLLNLGSSERRSVREWWRALRQVDIDAAILEKGTLWTGGLSLEVALRLKYGCYFTIQQLEPPPLPARASTRHLGGFVPGIGLWWHRWRWAGRIRTLAPRTTFCVSDGVRRRFMSDYGVSPRRLRTVHNGVDPSKFGPSLEARRSVRRKWSVPDSAFVFGSVGRLSIQKGLDVAIEAFACLVEQAPAAQVYLVLVGEGDQRPLLASLIELKGLVGRVILPGFASNPQEVYQGLDVFLIPSRFEGLPFALVEAMASGCDIIGSTAGGIPEAVPDTHRRDLVAPEDAAALCMAMKRALAADPAERAVRTAAARQHVAKHFDIRTQCMKIVNVVQQCTGRKSTAASA